MSRQSVQSSQAIKKNFQTGTKGMQQGRKEAKLNCSKFLLDKAEERLSKPESVRCLLATLCYDFNGNNKGCHSAFLFN